MDKTTSDILREPFAPELVGKKPGYTCRDCAKEFSKCCTKHKKSKCDVCKQWITSEHFHLDFIGHADVTNRLLMADPDWDWEPIGWGADGRPLLGNDGNGNVELWGRLTIGGVTRVGVGTSEANNKNLAKELISDFIRNAAMRFGVALELWTKNDMLEQTVEHAPTPSAEPQAKPAPQAARPVAETPREQVRAPQANTAPPAVAEETASTNTDEPCTSQQRTKITGKLKELYPDPAAGEARKATVRNILGFEVLELKTLTISQAGTLINELVKMVAKAG